MGGHFGEQFADCRTDFIGIDVIKDEERQPNVFSTVLK
jgi:hypothetical protein